MEKKRYRRKTYRRVGVSFAALFLVVSSILLLVQSSNMTEKMDAAAYSIQKENHYDLVSYDDDKDMSKQEYRRELVQYCNETFNEYSEMLLKAGLYSRVLLLDENGDVVLRSGDVLCVADGDSEYYALLLDTYFSPEQKELLFQHFHDKDSWEFSGDFQGFLRDTYQLVPQKITLRTETAKAIVFDFETQPSPGDTPIVIMQGEFGVDFLVDSCGEYTAPPSRNVLENCEAIARHSFRKCREWEQGRSDPFAFYDGAFAVAEGFGLGTIAAPIFYESNEVDIISIHGEKYYLVFGMYAIPPLQAFRMLWEILAILFLLCCFLVWLTARNFIKTYEKQLALEETRRNLTNAVAHELKTPLGIIRSCSEGLLEKINEKKRGHYLSVIVSETEYMDKAILDMLKVSEISMRERPLNLASCSLCALVRAEAARFEPVAAEKQIRLEYNLLWGFEIHCDKLLLSQVISNFLSNALRHTPPGGEIRLTVRAEKGKPYCSVENSGEFLEEEAQKKVWDVFYKADSARARTEGSGLGLAICREILEKHGFAYGVKNTENGVVFWFIGEN